MRFSWTCWVIVPVDVLLACVWATQLKAQEAYQDITIANLSTMAFFGALTLGLLLAYLFCGLAKLFVPNRLTFPRASFATAPRTTFVILLRLLFGSFVVR